MWKVPSLIRSRMVGLWEWKFFAMMINSRRDPRCGLSSGSLARHPFRVEPTNAVLLDESSTSRRAYSLYSKVYASRSELCRPVETVMSEFTRAHLPPGLEPLYTLRNSTIPRRYERNRLNSAPPVTMFHRAHSWIALIGMPSAIVRSCSVARCPRGATPQIGDSVKAVCDRIDNDCICIPLMFDNAGAMTSGC
jgi:hypothetical protein